MQEKNKDPVKKILTTRRSIRRFKQEPIPQQTLIEMIDVARLAPSAANLQPLEFIIIDRQDLKEKIFQTLSWAGYIKPAWTPSDNETPAAYIIILVKDKKNPWYTRDTSYAAANIVTYAESQNIGSCILCKIDKEKIREILKIPEKILIDSVIALGYKAEQPEIIELTDSVKYFRDESETLKVPKRRLDKIMKINKY